MAIQFQRLVVNTGIKMIGIALFLMQQSVNLVKAMYSLAIQH